MAIPSNTVKRLQTDYRELQRKPVDYVLAHPLEDNLLEWHYVVRGPPDCPFEGGVYHGKLVFPKEYPMKPPAIYMLTPNGKFQTNYRLCLTMSDYHPESWSPLWTTSSVLIGLLSFMIDDKSGGFTGQDLKPVHTQRELAQKSWAFNLNDRIFCKYFPQLAEEAKQRLK